MRRRFPSLLGVVGLVWCCGLAPATAAAPAPLAVGEVVVLVDSEATRSREQLVRALRSALADELISVARVGNFGKRPIVVSATLTKLLTEHQARRARVTASISLVLRRADDQVLFAELRGRASVEEAAESVAAVQQMALRGALRGAVARLPEAVERAR